MIRFTNNWTFVIATSLAMVASAAAQNPPRDYRPPEQPPRYPTSQPPRSPNYGPVRQNTQAGIRQPVYRTADSGARHAATPPRQANPAQAPFRLTPEQAAYLDQVLAAWEAESDKIRNYSCPLERWEYDEVFGPGGDVPKSKGKGQITYSKPDKGSFKIEEMLHYTPAKEQGEPATYEAREDEPGEHWVCDGEAVYEYNYTKKQLIVRVLPEEMRGKAIADGPLPFLFGAEKEKLQARYFLRVTAQTNEKQIWLEAYPRRSDDGANFSKVELILDRDKFLPAALQVYAPNPKQRTVYILKVEEASVNNRLEDLLPWFKKPRTPFGWKKVVEEPPPPPSADRRAAGRAPASPRAAR